MKAPHQILIKPVISEKGMYLSSTRNTYPFVVHIKANKVEVRNAVEKIYSVKVKSVRTLTVRGKPRKIGRYYGRTSNWKKAMVTLRQGDTIELI